MWEMKVWPTLDLKIILCPFFDLIIPIFWFYNLYKHFYCDNICVHSILQSFFSIILNYAEDGPKKRDQKNVRYMYVKICYFFHSILIEYIIFFLPCGLHGDASFFISALSLAEEIAHCFLFITYTP